MADRRIKFSEIKTTRDALLKQQNNICPLCGCVIESEDAALDHNHRTGRIRAVLHFGCNALLGKIENNAKRSRVSNLQTYLVNTAAFLNTPEKELLHPTFRTDEEKRLLRNKRARRKRNQRNQK